MGARDELYGLGSLATKWPNGVVPVCFANTASHPDLQADIQQILAQSWSAAANITFTGFGACIAHTFAVVVTFAPATVDGGVAYRGSTSALGENTVQMELISDDTPDHVRFKYEVLHEFGHALGFAHEMQRPDNWDGSTILQCAPTDVSDESQYVATPGGLYLTKTYDLNSIMNYCNPAGFPQALSAGDIAGVSSAAAYGPPLVPNCTMTASCGMQDNPQTNVLTPTELITVACASAPPSGGVESYAASTWSALPAFAPDTALPYNTEANEFLIGFQSVTGTTTSGAPVGSVQTVKACNSVNGTSYCDWPTPVTIPDCCIPRTCANSCGTLNNGCGAEITCSSVCGAGLSCINNTCKSCTGSCTRPYVWNTKDCECELPANTCPCGGVYPRCKPCK